jgi:protein-S-isoprenylcysteine O-methyltransferase Ste14
MPPVYFFGGLALMVALHLLLPVRQWLDWPWRWLGALLMLAGVSLVLWCALLFRRADTAIRPFQESSTLVMSGPYRLTRNPIYLSMAAALAGLAVLLGSLSPWLIVPAFIAWIDVRFIRREEPMLAARFGEEYAAYRSRVRRWI